MKRKTHRAPLALSSDGSVLLNATEFHGAKPAAELVEIALQQRGRVFIGVELKPKEVKVILDRLEHSTAEAAARIVARRRR